MKRSLLLILLLVCIPRLADAQTVTATSGTINGRVVDNTGAVLPGATVTTSSPSMMGTRTAVTNQEGFFRFPAVPPGTYRMVFELAGFTTVDRDGIEVALGFTATVNIDMTVAGIATTVTVSGASPVVDTQGTRITTTFSAPTLKNLPFTGEFYAMVSVTPAARLGRGIDVGGSQAMNPNDITVYGISSQHRPMVEGIVSTWSSTGYMYYSDFSSFSDVAINTAGNNAESPTPGVQSNFMSKSGGNQYHGSFFGAYENGDVQSHNIDARQVARGVSGGRAGIDPVDTNRLQAYRQYSADIGGFLVKDKLWWYYAHSNLGNEARVPNIIGKVKTSRNPTHSAKGTYNATSNVHLVGYFQESWKTLDPYATTGTSLARVSLANATFQPGSAWLQDYRSGVYKGEYNQVVSDRLFLEVRAGNWFVPWGNLPESPDYRYEDLVTGMVSGGARIYDDHRTRPQILGSATYFKRGWLGSHNFKVGGEVMREVTQIHDGGLRGDMVMILRSGVPSEVMIYESPNNSQNGLWTKAAYLTDVWSVNTRLTLNLGIRYDRYTPFLSAQEHPAGPNNPTPVRFSAVPSLIEWNNVAPRVGVTYDLSGKGKTILKFNYGSYWWNPASDLAGTLNPNQALWWKRYSWTDTNGDGLFQVGEQRTLLQSNGGVASVRIDPNLENSYTREAILTVERELAANFGVRTAFVWAGNRNLRANVNQNQPYAAFSVPVSIQDPGPDGRLGTADDGGSITAWNLAPQYVGLPTQNLTQVLPGARDNFYTWELTGDKRMSGSWSLRASVSTTSNQKDALLTNPNMAINRIDGQDRYRSWQANISGTFELPKDFRVSPLVRHQSGTTFGRTFVASLNSGSSTVLAEPFSAERNRNITIFDIRIEKGIRIYGRRLAGFVDVYNIFNANPAESQGTASGTSWGVPLLIVPPRIAKFGVKFDW